MRNIPRKIGRFYRARNQTT